MIRYLRVLAGPDHGRMFPLPSTGVVVIGSSHRNADICLHDLTVSRVHCEMELEIDQAVLAEADGAGDIFVNGERTIRRSLSRGDVIRVGRTELSYEEKTDDESDEEDEVEVALEVDETEAGEEVVQAVILEEEAEAVEVVEAVAVEEEAEYEIVEEDEEEAARPGDAAVASGARFLPGDRLRELTGHVLGHYQVGAPLARGHYGVLFRALDKKNDRVVALKVLLPEFPKSQEEMQRFAGAIKAVLPLQHPNLVTVVGAGRAESYTWLALEYVEGRSAAELRKSGMLHWPHALRVAVHLARALEFAHEHHFVHAQITPQNVLVRKQDKVALLNDLALTRALHGSALRQITLRNRLQTDLPYFAPEQTLPQAQIDARSDLYGLGAVSFALLTGRPPYEAEVQAQLVRKIREGKPPQARAFQVSVPDALDAVVSRLLAKKPADRPASAAAVVGELEGIAKEHGVAV